MLRIFNKIIFLSFIFCILICPQLLLNVDPFINDILGQLYQHRNQKKSYTSFFNYWFNSVLIGIILVSRFCILILFSHFNFSLILFCRITVEEMRRRSSQSMRRLKKLNNIFWTNENWLNKTTLQTNFLMKKSFCKYYK